MRRQQRSQRIPLQKNRVNRSMDSSQKFERLVMSAQQTRTRSVSIDYNANASLCCNAIIRREDPRSGGTTGRLTDVHSFTELHSRKPMRQNYQVAENSTAAGGQETDFSEAIYRAAIALKGRRPLEGKPYDYE